MALDFFAGCLGGCAGIVVGYPLDTVKVHIQTQDTRNPKYRGTWHCFRTLLAKESVSGLYRGMSSPMAGVAVINAIIFGVYGQTQKFLNDGLQSQHQLSGHFVAGVLAGVAQAPICSPIELAKTRLQLQDSGATTSPGQRRFAGPMDCLRHIYGTQGLRGVFSGLGITLLREAPSFGLYFLTYEALTRSDSQISTFHMLMAGGLAGTASWVFTYPIDVVKSRLQADGAGRYTGAMDCFRKSVGAEGYACMFRGLNSTIVRAFPTNAATFAVVTWTLRLLNEQEQSSPVASSSSSSREATLPGEAMHKRETHEVFQPTSRSWNALDRYGESSCHTIHTIGDATNVYLHQLADFGRVMMPHASAASDETLTTAGQAASSVHQLNRGLDCSYSDREFDEARHFDWSANVMHY